MSGATPPVVVGEVFVDFTLAHGSEGCKLRLGGVVHAARGLWAVGLPYALAVVCPAYLVQEVRNYATQHGCIDFIWLGDVIGAPNVIVIGDPTEVASQGYEDLLRTSRQVVLRDNVSELSPYSNVLIFPGHFDLAVVEPQFSRKARFCFDVAYNVEALSALAPYHGKTSGVIISTSSPLFEANGAVNLEALLLQAKALGAEWFLLKENRGGSRLFDLINGSTEPLPAQLSTTVNSVGVGDVYSAIMIGLLDRGCVEAAWRGARAATYYAQTTYPDDFKRDVQRDMALSIQNLRDLWGTHLPWHERPQRSIYLAAPDFTYLEKPEVDNAVESLAYHNFRVRRPVQENGELALDAKYSDRLETYGRDVALLRECDIVFAVPLGRDPGTLAEIGIALAINKPVVTFDPRGENNNTIIVAGSACYSRQLDECLNAVFQLLGQPA